MKKVLTISKILALFLFNYVIFFVKNPFLLTGILFLFILVGLVSNDPFMKRLKTVLPVALMIILFQLIFNSTEPVNMRFLLGYLAAIRLIAISLSVLFFLSITSLNELVQIFSFLPRKALLVMMMTCYFIPGVLNEGEKIKAVQKSRGMNMNNVHFITNIASLLVPLIHRVFQRAETLSMNILARGYEE